MNQKDFKEFIPNKFLLVLNNMYNAVTGKAETHIKRMGYNSSELMIMYVVEVNGPLTIQDIAERINVTSGNMTYTVNKLEKRGLMKRVPCSEDKRCSYIDFTDEGKEKWGDVMKELVSLLNKMFEDIDEKLVTDTIEKMKIIGKNLK